MKNTYQIIEGYGDPESPETLEDVNLLDITFSNEADAIEFSWHYYKQTTENNYRWQSYWCYVTTRTNLADALTEYIQTNYGDTK